jgi:hypothetical protein
MCSWTSRIHSASAQLLRPRHIRGAVRANLLCPLGIHRSACRHCSSYTVAAYQPPIIANARAGTDGMLMSQRKPLVSSALLALKLRGQYKLDADWPTSCQRCITRPASVNQDRQAHRQIVDSDILIRLECRLQGHGMRADHKGVQVIQRRSKPVWWGRLREGQAMLLREVQHSQPALAKRFRLCRACIVIAVCTCMHPATKVTGQHRCHYMQAASKERVPTSHRE